MSEELEPDMCEGPVHVVPVNDLIEHLDDDCPCGQATEAVFREDGSNGWLVTHHSLDEREEREAAMATIRTYRIGIGYDVWSLYRAFRTGHLRSALPKFAYQVRNYWWRHRHWGAWQAEADGGLSPLNARRGLTEKTARRRLAGDIERLGYEREAR